jgi:hypothetical protein
MKSKTLPPIVSGTFQLRSKLKHFENRAISIRKILREQEIKLLKSVESSQSAENALEIINQICTLCSFGRKASAEDASKVLDLVENLFDHLLTILSCIIDEAEKRVTKTGART